MNHQSTLDLIVMGALLPPETFVLAKREIANIPLMGTFFTRANNFVVDRKDRNSAVATMRDVAVRMEERKASLWMYLTGNNRYLLNNTRYPEGTRSRQSDATMLPFKKGAFHLAVQGQFDVVPVVVSTYPPFVSISDQQKP